MPKVRKTPVKSLRQPGEKKSKYKTPGYQNADELRAVATPSATEATEDAPTTLMWFPNAQPGDRVRVMRLDDRSRKWSTHGYFTPEEGYDERLAELWGGGQYWAQWLRRNTLGVEQIIGSERPMIPGAYKPPREVHGIKPVESTAGGGSPVVGRIPDGVNVKEFLDNVILARSLDALEQRSSGPVVTREPSSFDKLLDALAPAIPDLLKMLVSSRANPVLDQLARRLDELTAVVNRPAPTPAQGAMGDLIEGLKGLTKVREMLVGESPVKNEEEPMWDIARKALDVFTGPNAQRSTALPPGPGGVADATGTGDLPTMPLWQKLLLEYQSRLVDSAQRGIEPELVAELVARYVPDTQRGVLIELVQQPNVDALIVQVIPVMQNFPTWLRAFTVACRDELVGGGESNESEEPEAEKP